MNIQTYIPEIKALCNMHKVERLYMFGSQVSGNAKANSDVDLVVKFGAVDLYDYFDNYMALKVALQQVFHKEVDLVEEQTIRNPILKSAIDKHKQLIYG